MPVLDAESANPQAPGQITYGIEGGGTGLAIAIAADGTCTLSVNGTILATGVALATVLELVGALAATDVLTTKVTGDAAARLVVDADGTLRWSGGAGAPDVSIERYAAGALSITGAGAVKLVGPQLLFNSAGDTNLYSPGADQLRTDDDLLIGTAGKGLRVAEGSNARMGVSTLVAGTVVVSNTSVTANSRIFLTCQTPGGTPGFLRVSARSAGTSFTILSSSGTDTSVVGWLILEPA